MSFAGRARLVDVAHADRRLGPGFALGEVALRVGERERRVLRAQLGMARARLLHERCELRHLRLGRVRAAHARQWGRRDGPAALRAQLELRRRASRLRLRAAPDRPPPHRPGRRAPRSGSRRPPRAAARPPSRARVRSARAAPRTPRARAQHAASAYPSAKVRRSSTAATWAPACSLAPSLRAARSRAPRSPAISIGCASVASTSTPGRPTRREARPHADLEHRVLAQQRFGPRARGVGLRQLGVNDREGGRVLCGVREQRVERDLAFGRLGARARRDREQQRYLHGECLASREAWTDLRSGLRADDAGHDKAPWTSDPTAHARAPIAARHGPLGARGSVRTRARPRPIRGR